MAKKSKTIEAPVALQLLQEKVISQLEIKPEEARNIVITIQNGIITVEKEHYVKS